jgi:asparagine synthase (glutamine-hydrolysing)
VRKPKECSVTDTVLAAHGIVPTPIEIAAGTLIGTDSTAPHLRAVTGPAEDPLEAMGNVAHQGLERAPCLVSFSGGRDSSAVLALATAIARREALPLPIPITLRYPHVPATDETEWQEMVVRHLGLTEWVRIDVHDELEALGPVATDVLRRHGLLFPANAYLHTPMLELARGGALLTGAGGDELFSYGGSRLVKVLGGLVRPAPRDLLRVLAAIAPRALRAALARRRMTRERMWMTPEGEAQANKELAAWEASWPHRWERGLDAWWRSRPFQAASSALNLLASFHDVVIKSPFMDPAVLVAVGRVGGSAGFPNRSEAMRRFFCDLLPSALLMRSTKAAFDGTLWGHSTREFLTTWDGGGIDERLVERDALRQIWASEQPDSRTIELLHSVWLAGSTPAGAATARH